MRGRKAGRQTQVGGEVERSGLEGGIGHAACMSCVGAAAATLPSALFPSAFPLRCPATLADHPAQQPTSDTMRAPCTGGLE